MEIHGKETAYQRAREGSSHLLIGLDPTLSIFANVAREVNRNWTSKKHEEHWLTTHGQMQAKGFLRKSSAKNAGKCST
jgi:hypothetical protein